MRMSTRVISPTSRSQRVARQRNLHRGLAIASKLVVTAATALAVVHISFARIADASDFVILPVTITSNLPSGTIPINVHVDFAKTLHDANVKGVVDPNSVEVRSIATGKRESHAISPHIAYGDAAQVRWLITDPNSKKFEISFTSAEKRPVLKPRADTPLIGVGDLLRYTGAEPRPIASSLATRLVDLNGDGLRDLVATDYYTTEPLWPERIPDSWSPFLCYPGVKDGNPLLFGNAVRFRYREKPDARPVFRRRLHARRRGRRQSATSCRTWRSPRWRSHPMRARCRTWLISFTSISTPASATRAACPFSSTPTASRHPKDNWGPVRIVDLDRDGAVDFIVGGLLQRDKPQGLLHSQHEPRRLANQGAEAVAISPGAMAGFLDVDGDGMLDSVCVTHDDRWGNRNFCSRIAWHKGFGGNPPQYGPEQFLDGIDDELCEFVSTVDTGERKGVMVSAGYIGERILFYELQPPKDGKPRFKRARPWQLMRPSGRRPADAVHLRLER